jgi:hypothetical protein
LTEELFKNKQKCITKIVKNVKRVCLPIEADFEYVASEYGMKIRIFRKPEYAQHCHYKPPAILTYVVRGVGFEPTKALASRS